MKKTILILIAGAFLLAQFACESTEASPEAYEAIAPDTTDLAKVPDLEKYTEREFEAVKRLYKGPIYWTVTGDYIVTQSAYPGKQTISMVAQKVHWTRLAFYGPEGILGVKYKHTPIKGSINWHPYYELPEFPTIPDKILKKD
jgi:hypothetical protein